MTATDTSNIIEFGGGGSERVGFLNGLGLAHNFCVFFSTALIKFSAKNVSHQVNIYLALLKLDN